MSRLLPRLALASAASLVALGGGVAPAIAETPVAGPTTPALSADAPSPGAKPLLAEAFPNDIGGTSAIIRWNAPEDAIAGYRIVSPEGQRDEPSTTTQVSLRKLQPDTQYEVRVQSILADGESLSEALVVTFRTLPLRAPVTRDYGVTGSATVAKLVRGSLPLKGIASLTFGFGTGDVRPVTGTLALGQTTGRLAFGAFSVTAKIGFVSSGPATGGFGGFAGSLWLTQKVRIKVLETKLYGTIPLAAGNNCQSRQLTDLNLNGPPFSSAKGGVLTGTFKISDLNGCGVLNGLVSPETASDGNTISITLAAA